MTVLVTGAFGLVGSATVKQLATDRHRVVATDLDVPANRKKAEKLPSGVFVRYADLTDPAAVDDLLTNVAPTVIIHLAAVIPPVCYLRPGVARKVNVDATANLLRAAEKQKSPPRFLQASSIATYGARNPHTITEVLTSDTPVNPSDIYGAHKVEAERLVRDSTLDWSVLLCHQRGVGAQTLGRQPRITHAGADREHADEQPGRHTHQNASPAPHWRAVFAGRLWYRLLLTHAFATPAAAPTQD